MGLDWFFTAHPLTLVIAPVVGAYLCVSGAGLLRKEAVEALLLDLCIHPAEMHAVGAIAFLAGAGILSFHRFWGTPAEIVLNLIAALWIFEGAGLLADPARLRTVLARPTAAARLRSLQAFNMLVGLYLLALGGIGQPV